MALEIELLCVLVHIIIYVEKKYNITSNRSSSHFFNTFLQLWSRVCQNFIHMIKLAKSSKRLSMFNVVSGAKERSAQHTVKRDWLIEANRFVISCVLVTFPIRTIVYCKEVISTKCIILYIFLPLIAKTSSATKSRIFFSSKRVRPRQRFCSWYQVNLTIQILFISNKLISFRFRRRQ